VTFLGIDLVLFLAAVVTIAAVQTLSQSTKERRCRLMTRAGLSRSTRAAGVGMGSTPSPRANVQTLTGGARQ
jgi:hypothetical protein